PPTHPLLHSFPTRRSSDLASPNFRIRSESENCRAMNEMPAVPWVSTQAGPTTSTAFLKAVYLSCPAIRRSRAANVSCIENAVLRSEEHTSELQSRGHLVCR